ncbi:hypothetical protein [Erysipelothrix aquatica]|uniref:hypothetical protein n=1 Tax=Erysipelothrix aquatica TaxID=2683714 RepID=UPI00135989AD|nr:hypothetical protein [Erysipelothrix aquatica]
MYQITHLVSILVSLTTAITLLLIIRILVLIEQLTTQDFIKWTITILLLVVGTLGIQLVSFA